MRTFLLITILAFAFRAQSQDRIYDNFTVDTIRLNEINFKKVIVYRLSEVTFYVNYYAYKKELYKFWKRYHDGMKGHVRDKRNGDYINPDYEPRWLTIDSVYKLIKTQVKTKDTIIISQDIFDKVGIGPLGNFFPDLIEENQCAIFDKRNQRHYIRIRHKGSRVRGLLDGYGGRAYYFQGQTYHFISAGDWVS